MLLRFLVLTPISCSVPFPLQVAQKSPDATLRSINFTLITRSAGAKPESRNWKRTSCSAWDRSSLGSAPSFVHQWWLLAAGMCQVGTCSQRWARVRNRVAMECQLECEWTSCLLQTSHPKVKLAAISHSRLPVRALNRQPPNFFGGRLGGRSHFDITLPYFSLAQVTAFLHSAHVTPVWFVHQNVLGGSAVCKGKPSLRTTFCCCKGGVGDRPLIKPQNSNSRHHLLGLVSSIVCVCVCPFLPAVILTWLKLFSVCVHLHMEFFGIEQRPRGRG